MTSLKSRFEYHRVFVGLFVPKKGWKATKIKTTSVASALSYAWNNTLMDYVNKLQLSIPKRINAVLAAKGKHTEY